MPTVPGSRPTAVYRLHDCKGRLLYVGSAFNPKVRLAQHAAEKPWWPEVDAGRTIIEWHDEERAAADAEHAAALAERPTYGHPKKRIIVGYPSPRPRTMRPTPAPQLAALPPTGELVERSPGRYLLRIGGRTVTIATPDGALSERTANNVLGALRAHGYRPPINPQHTGHATYERIRLAAAA
ncbi:hypothetical protein ACIA7S_28385 [Streptomyces sp. NPDC051643]|uniref:hypothetical protein n=1 Tax=Streptomyces sp. NPDC051643 TaxID=3365665 RepID=UPI0037B0307A